MSEAFQPSSNLDATTRSFLDYSLKRHGNFGVYGDLSNGLVALEEAMNVRVRVLSECIEVDAGPKSNAGHDFQFTVSRANGAINTPVVGEVAPPPKFE